MRPSSRKALVAGVVLAVASAVLYLSAQDTPAPDLTASHVDFMLGRIARAIRQRNTDEAFAYVTPNALLFGEKRSRLEQYARRALREASPGAVVIHWSNLAVVSQGNRGIAEFDVSVGERIAGMDAVYFSGHVTLHLRKVRRPRPLGLGSVEAWYVDQATSSTDIFAGG